MNFMNALSAVQDVNDINGNGLTTDAICKDAIARDQGCVAANIFGANTLSPEAARYIHAPSSLNTRLTQNLMGVSVSGDPFSLPAGPVGIAFGGEYRKETSSMEFDALTQTGLNAGNALPNTAGAFDVQEVFVEARLPLLKNLPLMKALDAQVAVRQGKYSTVGDTTSWNSGLDWGVNSTFRCARQLLGVHPRTQYQRVVPGTVADLPDRPGRPLQWQDADRHGCHRRRLPPEPGRGGQHERQWRQCSS